MNFSKPPVLSDSLTTVLSSTPGLEATLGAASTALSNPLLASSWQKASGAIAFIDANVTDYQALVAGIAPGTEVHVLNSSQDAVTQITNTLLGRQNISSLHVVSHGEAGGLNFGSNRLNLSDLPEYAAQLQSWGGALTDDADILLYGCNVAQGELGQAFTSILSQLTGADVAASDNLTGIGGDWTLEVATGAIENAFAFSSKALDSYTGTLVYTLGARSAIGSGGDVFLGGEFIELGIEASGGYFGTSDAKPVNFFGTSARTRVGLSIDPDSYQTGDTFTYDVFLPGTPLEGFALGYTLGGTNYAYENSGGNVLQLTNTSVANTSSGNTLSAVVTSTTAQNIVLTQTYSFDYTKDYWSTVLNVTNNSGSAISNLRYLRYFDPDIAVDAGGSTPTTNTILNSTSVDGRVVIEAKVPSSDTTFAARGPRPAYFVSTDPLARGFIGSYFFLRDAGGINALNETAKGTTVTSDTSIGIWFDVGTVTAGASKTFNFTSGLSSDIISTIEAIPSITTNTLTITEGSTVVLSSSNLNTTDPDNTPAQLTYTVSGTPNGRFELVSAPGTAITSFTQAQIDSGVVQFVHNGGETPPAYSLTVNDGLATSASSTVAIGTFTNVNDVPTINTNSLSVSEGGSVVLTSSNVNATDPDNTAAQLTYTASSISGGRFELVASPGNAITSFTQAQINSSAVRFVHSGGETAPSYSLSVSDGLATSAPRTVAIGTFTNVNDAPTINTNALSLSEGGSVVLSNSNINATDPDNTPAQLTYTASSISGGRFELVASPGNAITSFTQAQISSGAVRFVHSGGETAPSYSLSVSDGLATSAPSTVAIGTFTNVNDAPTISTNALSLSEGGSVVLSNSNINATDPDNTPAQLVYIASSISGGQFELVANAGVAITSFTQAQISSGAVRFIHDGGETAPSYSLSVNDGLATSAPSTVAIGTFTNVNDAPTISTNALSLSEGGSVVLSNSNINSVDPDNTPAQLTYTASSISGGRFELVASPGNAITSFTQAQISSGAVRFVHDGGEAAPSYSLSVNDGLATSAPSTVAIGTFTNVNDAPTISTNALSLSEGGSVVLSSSNINATDPDNTAAQLTYTASSISGGRFELVASPGNAITSFTQAQISSGEVRFVHDGGEAAPSYSLSVNDGLATSAPSTVAIGTFTNVNDAPTISTNALSLSEGGSVVLSSSNINATDPDNTAAQLTYTASSISGGRFELVASPGNAITSFTQAQISSGAVRFVHDGGEAAPSYSLSVNDGLATSAPSTVAIGTFTNVNDAPTISTNSLSVSEGGSVVLSSSNINATDPDNTAAQLTYTASSISGGRFELVANAGVAITGFTQAQINAGEVRFVQDGSENVPTYNLTVGDGMTNSSSSIVTIPPGGFTTVNDAPTISTNALSIAEGAAIVLSSSNINSVDPDNTPAQLTYTASNISGGQFELVANAGVVITSFTQAQINAGDVRFVHSGGETAPTYSLSVSDGSLSSSSSTVAIGTFTNVNDAPTLTGNATLAAVNQNATNATGSTLTSLFSSLFSDPDASASLSGLAIVGNPANATTQGRWQYSLTGTTWSDIGTVAEGATALALSASTLVRFVPAIGYNGTPPSLSVRALDNTYSGGFTTTTPVLVNTTTNGGSTAIAATATTLSTSVTPSIPNLLWRNAASNENVDWQLNNYSVQSSYFLPSFTEAGWQIAASNADFNQDGFVDILWRNQNTGLNVIWEMNSTGLQTRYFIEPIADTNWQIAGTADYNRDGITDIVWRNQASGENVVWQQNGATLVTRYFLPSVVEAGWQIVSTTGDFNRDGIGDLLWRNQTTGANVIWQMNSTGLRETGYFIQSLADPNWQIAGTGDLDRDGVADIVWRNRTSGENAIWKVTGTSVQSVFFTQVADTNWQIAGVADLGGNSTPELLWQNKVAGQEVIWQMNGFSLAQGYELPAVRDANWSVRPFVSAALPAPTTPA